MTKVISLSDPAYKRLSMLKGEKESFSEVVMKITEKESKRSLLDFAGAWEDDKEEMTTIFEKIAKERKKAKIRAVRL